MVKNYWKYVVVFLIMTSVHAQNPIAFQITSEEGLPNQTVYSIIQDDRGFLWMGTDAGLYRYDGIRYNGYKHPLQKSSSLTGLQKSADGKLYAYNFNGQIFYLEHDSLKILSGWDKGIISNICTDKKSNLWVSYADGIAMRSSQTHSWKYFAIRPNFKNEKNTHSCFIDNDDVFWCLGPNGLIKIEDEKETYYNIEWGKEKVSGEYQLAFFSNQKFIFSRIDGDIFRLNSGKIEPFYSENLNPLLKNKKITRIEEDTKGHIWIYTFSGVIVYDTKINTSELLYENNSFSCGIQDSENTYWFGTLHDGLLRVPELSHKLWVIKNNESANTRINKIVCNNSSIFFSSDNGKIGELNKKNSTINLMSLQKMLDVQCLALSENKQSVLFGVQNSVFQWSQNKTETISKIFPPAKDILQINSHYVIATSRGAFWYNPNNPNETESLTPLWTRSIAYDKLNNQLWLATNDGIKVYKYINERWNLSNTLLEGTQVTSIYFSSSLNKLFALTFNGHLYEINTDSKPILLASLNQSIAAYQLLATAHYLFLATNKGLWRYDFKSKQILLIDRLAGLASNSVDGLALDSQHIWLATAKGIQQIPFNIASKKTISKIYLKNISVNNNIITYKNELNLQYKDELKIELDAVSLSSENQFKYAYRLNNNSWIFLPAEINQIEFPAFSSGAFNLEIKLINHLSQNSENHILITGYVNPPFWQRWWFYFAIGAACLLVAFLAFKQRIKNIQKKQSKELERINLEHQLKLSQETALRAQMNPHFIFNVLNSIKSYIYENDKKKATSYLQRFSDLVRKILEQSSMSWVKLDEEIEFLKLYIELESMLFMEDFSYSIYTDETLDTSHTYLPSLVLQPFIENAFKHGLRHKEGEKQLTINFHVEENSNILVIKITDNGVGRNCSNKINNSNFKKHQSFSTEAINKVSLLNQNTPGIIAVVYTDLFDNDHKSIGTMVEIKIKPNE